LNRLIIQYPLLFLQFCRLVWCHCGRLAS